MSRKQQQLGKLPPRYTFFLNPYDDVRFTSCPMCERKMRQRKLPLLINVDPLNPVAINMTCRFCPECDLLIAHKDVVESLLAAIFTQRNPDIIGNDYLVLGTYDRAAWKKGMETPTTAGTMTENLHDFKEVVTFKVTRGWVPSDR
jgi:hypothetical protein